MWWPKRKQLHVARHASAIIRSSPPPTARSVEEAPLVSHCPANVDAVEAVSLVDGLMPKPNGIRTSFLGEGDDRWLEGFTARSHHVRRRPERLNCLRPSPFSARLQFVQKVNRLHFLRRLHFLITSDLKIHAIICRAESQLIRSGLNPFRINPK